MTTTPLRPIDNVTMAAARVKQAAPNTFTEFVEAVAALSAQRNAECVQAPSDQVLKAQGKAQQLQDLLSILRDCSEDAKALHAKMQPKEKT